MLKPEMMKIFMTVCETESFTSSAQVLGIPKASVSDAIQKLETSVGTRLLQRTTRKVTITHDGLQFYERCKDLLADFEEAESMFQESGPSISGKIRVDMPVPFAKNLIIPKLPAFLEKYPNLELELSSTDRRVDIVREGFDFVIRIGRLSDSSLIAKKIGEYKVVNCASREYLEKFGTPKNIDDLSKHFQVHYEQTFGGRPDGFEYWDGTKYVLHKTKSKITVNSTDAYLAAALAGLGIIQGLGSGLDEYIKSGKLRKILTKYDSEPASIYIVYPQRRHVAKRVRLLMDWMEEQIKGYIK